MVKTCQNPWFLAVMVLSHFFRWFLHGLIIPSMECLGKLGCSLLLRCGLSLWCGLLHGFHGVPGGLGKCCFDLPLLTGAFYFNAGNFRD